MYPADDMLRSFGLDPRWTREALAKGKLHEVLRLLQKEESRISLRRMELEDLREALIAWAEESSSCEELSDEDMEFLSAAGEGEERRVDP